MSPTGGIWCIPWDQTVAFAAQKYNADYDLSATQSADTLAFVSLLEEKLLPVLVRLGGAAGKGGSPRMGSASWSCAGGLGCVPACQQGQRALPAAASQEPGMAGIRVWGWQQWVVQPGLGSALHPSAPAAPHGLQGSYAGQGLWCARQGLWCAGSAGCSPAMAGL